MTTLRQSSVPFLTPDEVERTILDALARLPYDGKRVLVLVPDLTRTMPLPEFFRLIVRGLKPRTAKLDFLVALGTHPALDEALMDKLFGCVPGERGRDSSSLVVHRAGEPLYRLKGTKK